MNSSSSIAVWPAPSRSPFSARGIFFMLMLALAGVVLALAQSHEVMLRPGDVEVSQGGWLPVGSDVHRCDGVNCSQRVAWFHRFWTVEEGAQRVYFVHHPVVLEGSSMPMLDRHMQGWPVRDAQGREGMVRGFVPYLVLLHGVSLDKAPAADLKALAQGYRADPGLDATHNPNSGVLRIHVGLREVVVSAYAALHEVASQHTWAWINTHRDAFLDEVQQHLTHNADALLQRRHAGLAIGWSKPLRFQVFDPQQAHQWRVNAAIDAEGPTHGIPYALFRKELQAGQIDLLVTQMMNTAFINVSPSLMAHAAQQAARENQALQTRLDASAPARAASQPGAH